MCVYFEQIALLNKKRNTIGKRMQQVAIGKKHEDNNCINT